MVITWLMPTSSSDKTKVAPGQVMGVASVCAASLSTSKRYDASGMRCVIGIGECSEGINY